MMIRRSTIALLTALMLLGACKSDEGSTKGETTGVTETTGATTAQVEDPQPTTHPSDEKAGTFGALVDGATTLTVTQRVADGDADYGGEARATSDAEWIAKFVTAIGPDQPGAEAVPRCLPTYTIAFANADGELATFGGVCGGMDTVILVRDGSSYAADDSATARTMLQELAKTEPVPAPAE